MSVIVRRGGRKGSYEGFDKAVRFMLAEINAYNLVRNVPMV
jgi:hypothetical protein